MNLGVGIDTGGTYTDAVIYDFKERKILSFAKALTTREDLAVGIGNALDGLDQGLLTKAGLVSLSTTLATNACVENKGGRAKLVMLCNDKNVVNNVGAAYGLPPVEEICFVDGKTSFYGEVEQEPDWDAFLQENQAWAADADALGVVELYAMKNNARLEKKAKELMEAHWGIPVICGYELFSDLNSIQRGSSTLLNGKLIPVIDEFLRAIRQSLTKRGIQAPVVIVRSDGTLMSEDFTSVRPVETLVCGPAASVMGGVALTRQENCLIVDMGGTTTDMAMVKEGIPQREKDGINVGSWRTFVKGIAIDTYGLGGDSAIHFSKEGDMLLGPRRFVPLCILADRWPEVTEKLRALLNRDSRPNLSMTQFLALNREVDSDARFSPAELALCEALKQGPLSLPEAAPILGMHPYDMKTTRLEEEGVVARSGLTPTDIMHVVGDFTLYSQEAAQLGVRLMAGFLEIPTESLCSLVYENVKKTIYFHIVRMLLEDAYPSIRKNGLGDGLTEHISRSWELAKDGNGSFIQFGFQTPAALIGIGAPIHIFLPDVAKALHAQCLVPEYAPVANALGALTGNIMAQVTVEVKPDLSDGIISGYFVYGQKQTHHVLKKDEAVALAIAEAEAAAREEAIRRGAGNDLTVKTQMNTQEAKAKGGIRVLLGIFAESTAIGRVGL